MLQLRKTLLTLTTLFISCFTISALASPTENPNAACCTQTAYPSIFSKLAPFVANTSNSIAQKSEWLSPGMASFKGWYVGLNGGYAKGTSNVTTTATSSSNNYNSYLSIPEVPQVNQAGIGTLNPAGFTGGIQGGYNWQFNRWLVGFDVDVNYLGLNSSRQVTDVYVDAAPSTFTLNQSVQTNWLVTARPRIGFVIKRFLVYLNAGLAITQLQTNNNFSDNYIDPGPPPRATNPYGASNTSTLEYGWVAGAGLEFSLTKKWSLKGEYLHASFPTISTSNGLTANPDVYRNGITDTFAHTANLSVDIARLGINYHF